MTDRISRTLQTEVSRVRPSSRDPLASWSRGHGQSADRGERGLRRQVALPPVDARPSAPRPHGAAVATVSIVVVSLGFAGVEVV